MSQQILAKNTVIGKTYLLAISPSSIYKLTISRITKMDNNTCNSVGVIDERYPNTVINISPETSLLEWDEELYSKVKKDKVKEEKVKKDKVKEEKVKKVRDKQVVVNRVEVKEVQLKKERRNKMSRTVNPRSEIIDKYLASLPQGEKPDYQKIVNLVIEAGRGKEEDAKKIIFQSKLRYKWYTVEGKVNKFAKVEGEA